MIDNKTIYALSSGKPRAGVAVVRVSGPAAGEALVALSSKSLPKPRRANLRQLWHPLTQAPVDEAIVIWFPAPASFTGEDVAELHVTGGVAVVAALLSALSTIDGLRLAAPGEFARRAFDNGKLDLTQAEGLADLIDAETEVQRLQALRQASGGLKAAAADWHARLIAALAEIEASLDFADDEEDVSTRMIRDQAPAIEALAAEIDNHLAKFAFAERLRRGVNIVVLGAPNIGKSSLVNALARRDVAIVSPEAGTTRDLIEVHLDLGGVPAVLVDTAGLRRTVDGVEAEGVRRARARAVEADIVLHLIGPGETAEPGAIAVLTKADARDARVEAALEVSSLTGEGLGALEAILAERAAELAGKGEDALVTRERQRGALAACVSHLHAGACESDTVLCAEALRQALRALGELTGRVSAERILDVIFGRFCIGK